jgi:glycosyltransferase involved in cell wall biosynthesis
LGNLTGSSGTKLGICYVAVDVPIPSPRGSSTHVTEVSKNLQGLGANVVVLSRRLGSWQPKSEPIQGLTVFRAYRGILFPLENRRIGGASESERISVLNSLYRLYISTLLALYCGLVATRLVRKYQLHAVIERETSYGAGAIASILAGRPLILEVNGPRFNPISPRRASAITAYSYSMVSKKFKDKTIIVDAGVDTELFRPDQEAGLAIRRKYYLGESPVIGYVGTFQAWHGVDDMIHAGKFVLQSCPDAKFLMVGPGFESTQALAKKLGVDGFCVFTGSVPYDQVPMYINAADILVSPTNPSKSEWTRTHGPPEQFKIFEYMACRKPVIATAVGPMQRVVMDRITGLTVPAGNPEALSNAMCELIRDKKLAETLAAHGFAQVIERYSWLNHAKEIREVILSNLRNKGKSRAE